VEARRAELARAVLDLDAVNARSAEAEARRAAITEERDAAKKAMDELYTDRSRLERKLQRIDHNFVNDWFRDRPLVDFIAPSLKVNQIVVEDLKNDINYLTIPRVDRCTTCHLGIDKKGYEDAPQPFRTHPRLDVFIDGNSPHPIDSFGCTVCHLGRDRGTSFVHAAHTPSDEEEAKRWEEEHGWEKMHHWEEPMFPARYTEASCAQCHSGVVDVPGADHLNYGNFLIENFGCTGCHKIQGRENLPKAGPSLRALPGKTTPEWAFHWIKDPKGFRPTTRMPRFFDLENTSNAYYTARNDVEARAIVSYLFGAGAAAALDPLPAGLSGSASRGKDLVTNVGCRGCHLMEGETPDPAHRYRRFGPALTGIGSKTTARWVYNWVKDPKRMMPTTRMPDLRLTDQEALDVATYLVGLRNEEFEGRAMPAADDTLRDAVVLEYLKVTMTDRDARERLASMSPEERERHLGEKLIGRYGCFACHEIAGFEEGKRIGTELTQEGSKPVHRFDFGLIEMEPSRQAWIRQKLLNPRIYDRGKVKEPQEKLRMPDFGFTEDEADAITLAVLSLRKRELTEAKWDALQGEESVAQAGWRTVRSRNCRGCHQIDGEGGDLRALFEDPGLGPPILMGEGDRVQAEWLFDFIKKPTTIRPWLSVRMPTFHFTDEEADGLVRYFAATAPKGGGFQVVPPEALAAGSVAHGKQIFEAYKCIQCHQVGQTTRDPADLAPDLTMASARLRPGWIADWLTDPQVLMPNTRMPSYFYSGGDKLVEDADAQIVDLRNYVWTLGKR
jgi:cbb3-type cytochrome oxidase cytochrome c subunit